LDHRFNPRPFVGLGKVFEKFGGGEYYGAKGAKELGAAFKAVVSAGAIAVDDEGFA